MRIPESILMRDSRQSSILGILFAFMGWDWG